MQLTTVLKIRPSFFLILRTEISRKIKQREKKNFNITLTGCGDAASAVKVTASGTPDEADVMAFANNVSSGDGGATGVGIYVYETDNVT
ncbi:hypothetical protein AU512_11910 [Lonsdalea iberica]|uniref:Fimbrial-type adhesion domain-containing protein n=1 Tax=Lonsdalea iberica TaxID=1082703 RepID=A0ABX3XF92_9GAMM|nr:fimbrial protein [Lonsdalea iberica]OSN09826.1 hypothetical protein AU512_11910 [Lonsdalea iberica]